MLFSYLYTELAAAIPQTEVVGKGDYFRFGMRDSLAIDAGYIICSHFLLYSKLAIDLIFIVHLRL